MSKLMLKHEDLRFLLQVFQWKIGDTFIEKLSTNEHTYLGFTQLLGHLERKWEQFCDLGCVFDIMNKKYTNKIDFWFSICTYYIPVANSFPPLLHSFLWPYTINPPLQYLGTYCKGYSRTVLYFVMQAAHGLVNTGYLVSMYNFYSLLIL